MYVKPKSNRVLIAKCEIGDVLVSLQHKQEWKVVPLPDDLVKIERGNVTLRMPSETLLYNFYRIKDKETEV